jgi:hypothetical protein
MNEDEFLAARFEEHRPRLRAVAFRMPGSASEADDAVQEAWLRLSRTDVDEVDNLAAWLTTAVARVSLNMLRWRDTRREELRDIHQTDTADAGQAAPTLSTRTARRLGRPGTAGGPGQADPRRTAGVRPARHVRRAVRGDRPDRGANSGGDPAARQPRAPPGAGSTGGFRNR